MNQELQDLSADDWYKILKNPISFMDLVLGYSPFEYQIGFLLDGNQRQIFKAGRQVGKSTVTAVKALHTAFSNPNEQILIIAPTQRQSSLIFNKIVNCIQQSAFIQSKILNQTQTMILFTNGSQIYCLPAGRYGFGIMGFSPTMIIVDEAAFVPEEVFNAIIPSLAATGGKLILISTPFGKKGTFYISYHDSHWSQHTATSEDSPLITKEFLEIERQRTTESEFRQWYMGEFIEEVDAFISKEIYQSAEEDYVMELRPDRDYYLGVDIARYGTDETVMIIVSVDNENNTRIEYLESTSKKPTTDTVGRIIGLHKEWNFRMIFVDETGLGGGPVDELEQNKLCPTCKEITVENYCKKCNTPTYSIPINPIIFELRDKADMYKHLLWLFERKANHKTKATITVPRMELKLMNQTTSLMKEYTSTGILKVHSPERGHDDYPDALALACLSTFKIEKDKIIDLED